MPTDHELVRWFSREPLNLAVVTGQVSQVVVVHADTPEALSACTKRLPYTPWQTRTARGFHLWYRHPGVHVPNWTGCVILRASVHVRGDGGFVIGAGSVHKTGAVYEFAGDWRALRDDLPRFWLGWVQRSPQRARAQRAPVPTMHGPVIEHARRYLAAIPKPEIGHGSDAATLSAACRLVRGFNLSASDAEALLCEWAGNRPGWTRDWIGRKVANAERYGTEPIGALR